MTTRARAAEAEDTLVEASTPVDDAAFVPRPELFQSYLDEWRARYNGLREERRYAQDRSLAFAYDVRLSQYAEGVKVVQATMQIPVNAAGEAQWTQFGTPEAKVWKFRVPPGGLEEQDDSQWIIHTDHYRYQTNNPFHIAYLRMIVDKQGIYGMREMEPGMVAMFGPKGAWMGWMPQAQAEMVIAGGGTRGW